MRVVSVTPAGRRRYMEILVAHLLRQRHVIAEHHWWLNTNVPEDIAFVRQTCIDHPDFFHVCNKPFDPKRTHGDNIWKFFKEYVDPNSLYVRFDDDIIWMADEAVERLVQFRMRHRNPPLVLGNIVNNAVCTAAHQTAGLIGTQCGIVRPECMDDLAWKNGRFARVVHEKFLADLEADRTTRWTKVEIPIELGQRFSINAISWFGETLAAVPQIAFDEFDEEPFLTERLPRELGHANVVCNEALFAHFAFWPQREYLDWTSDDLLERYSALAERRSPKSSMIGGYRRRDATWRMSKPFRKLHRSVMKRLGKAA